MGEALRSSKPLWWRMELIELVEQIDGVEIFIHLKVVLLHVMSRRITINSAPKKKEGRQKLGKRATEATNVKGNALIQHYS